jgi:hypothetical protein
MSVYQRLAYSHSEEDSSPRENRIEAAHAGTAFGIDMNKKAH